MLYRTAGFTDDSGMPAFSFPPLSRLAAGWRARQFGKPSGIAGRLIFGPWLDRIGRTMNRFVLDRLGRVTGLDVVEIGFGGGDLIARLLARGARRVTGVEVSEAMLARARRRFRGAVAQLRVRLVQASAEALPLADASADAALSLNSVYFWPDPEGAFGELARVVRPGGRLLVAFEPPEELRKWPGHRHGFRLWEVSEVRALMEQAGFELVEESWGTGRRPDRFCCLSATRGGANG